MLTYSEKAIANKPVFGHDFDRINKIGRAISRAIKNLEHPLNPGWRIAECLVVTAAVQPQIER
jgi:hypothetical protein